jgi:dipeptidyl aminopeptidase/acylaminoacyl peptidase
VTVRRAPLAGANGGDVETVVDSGHVTGLDAAGGRVAVVRSEWDHPGDVFVVDTEAETEDRDGERRLTAVNADLLADRHVGEPEEVRFESDDGVEIQGWVLHPPEFDPGETYPLAVEIHGGPHAMWTTSGTMFHEFQTLAARGYAVFWCNPRGSTGYGADFAAAIADDWGPATARDVLAGVEAVAERPAVDADQAFLTGGSFGGYMTAWMVAPETSSRRSG